MAEAADDGLSRNLEEKKWEDEIILRKKELRIKEREQRSKEKEVALRLDESKKSTWSSPLVIAIAAATITGILNLIVNYENGVQQVKLEDRKAENERILKVVNGDSEIVADNIQALLDMNLINDPETRQHVQEYLDNRAPGQGLSSGAAHAPVFQPPPRPTGNSPFHLDLSSVPGVLGANAANKLVFQVTGDTGSEQEPNIRTAVAKAMEREFVTSSLDDRPKFLYLLGNIVFYYGEASNYYSQFYQPFADYPAPILAIPGNHDADVPSSDYSIQSLDAYMRNFASHNPVSSPDARGDKRQTMTEPNSYWTLLTPFATIIGLYTNVPAGGLIDDDQKAWLESEMENAPKDKALILSMHHSPMSFAQGVRGSAQLASLLNDAVNKSRRIPNAILSAGAFNYQRIDAPSPVGKIPFLNVGSGGYFKLHVIGAQAGATDPQRGASLTASDDEDHGFLTFEIDNQTIKGRFTKAWSTKDAATPADPAGDTFTYSAKPLFLTAGQSIAW